jgi:nitrogenase molybdenum-cofactor synthesis protein NifE
MEGRAMDEIDMMDSIDSMKRIVLEGRRAQVGEAGTGERPIECAKPSLAGSVSQRACVFCGSRVVLYPVADALHLVHGPIGCAAYTWDIRGAVSSGPELFRMSFCTDMREEDVVFGGAAKLAAALDRLIPDYSPQAAFVYSTCVAGVIGDDVEGTCARAEERHGIPVIAVKSEGFRGTKKHGYRAACDALMRLVGTAEPRRTAAPTINILGEFNIAGEAWIIRRYYERMGVGVSCVMTGDGRVDEIRRSHGADLNVVQCSGSMTALAEAMREKYGIPYIRVSFFGIEDTAEALYAVARAFPRNPGVMDEAKALVGEELAALLPELAQIRAGLEGKKAAIYVGGAFKAKSLVKALRHLGMRTVLVGSQTGDGDDYGELSAICDPGTVIVDDSNPAELSRFLVEKEADLFIGGVKERPMAIKLGLGFCDHNHERKTTLAGFEGMLNFAREVGASALSPAWGFARRRAK